MRRLYCVLAALGFVMLAASKPAVASVVVHVDRSNQRMEVIVDGEPRYNWRVSTARHGYITPPGTYHPERLAVRWFSSNTTIRRCRIRSSSTAATPSMALTRISWVGHPVSHGCVRLDPGNAAILFGLVERQGSDNTMIVVH